MKALILVGGYGTRLRPLTLSVPKPLIHFCNKSIIEYQIASFKRVGVDHLILAVAYQSAAMLKALEDLEKKYQLKITCSKEDEPLGTAGPIRLAKPLLTAPTPGLVDIGSANGCNRNEASSSTQSITSEVPRESSLDDCFFVCNSDVICRFPFEEMLNFHRHIGAEATILVTAVCDPSKYGVVLHDDDGHVTRFVEKPTNFVGNWVNAGIYILNKSVIDRIRPGPSSIEKSLFPSMAADGRLFCFKLDGYWADIGQPLDFLQGMQLHLEDLRRSKIYRNGLPSFGEVDLENANDVDSSKNDSAPFLVHMHSQELQLAEGPQFIGNVLVAPSAQIGDGSVIGPNVTVDEDVVIGKGCRLKDCALMRGVHVGDFAWVDKTIVGWQSKIGKWVRVEGLTVVGENVNVCDECFVNGAFILPHKNIAESIPDSGTIVM